MTIKDLINFLEKLPNDTLIKNIDINDYGSDRGDFKSFYIGLGDEDVEKEKIIDLLRKSLNEKFEMYKGGECTFNENSTVKLSNFGKIGEDFEIIYFTTGEYTEVKLITYE